MTNGAAQTISVTIKRWLLNDEQDMLLCLKSIQGYRGQVRKTFLPAPIDPPEGYVPEELYDLELNDEQSFGRASLQASMGQVVVYFGNILQVMTVDQFTTQFGVEP